MVKCFGAKILLSAYTYNDYKFKDIYHTKVEVYMEYFF